MAYYLHCKCYSWQFKSGFGARIPPTMKKMVPQSVSFEVPLGPIEDSKLHDAECVWKKQRNSVSTDCVWSMSRESVL
jgi:hypothetical protein